MSLNHALEAARRGWSVFPVKGKVPTVKWKDKATRDEKDIYAWLSGSADNYGIACGPSGLLVIDEDTPGGFDRFAADHGVTVPATYTVATGRGRHLYFNANGHALGNAKHALAGYGVDVRGNGGYVVGPGSKHANGATYTVTSDVEPAPVPEWLHEALTAPQQPTSGPLGDPFHRGGLEAVPEVIPHGQRDEVLFRYASSLRARNVPVDEAEVLLMAVWQRCQQPPECPEPHTWPQALATLRSVYDRFPAGKSNSATDDPHDADTAGYPRSWQPVDLTKVLDGEWERPQPSVGARHDGVGLFYPGKVHTISSESEAGKTWFALSAVIDEMRAGHHVLYIDFEDDEGTIVGRLLDLQVPAATIAAQFHYVRPDQPVGTGIHADDLDAAVTAHPDTTLAIIDGVTEAMALHGLNLLDNTDIATFSMRLPRRIAQHGPAVACLDHVVKDSEQRGRYALGGVHKLNGLDGAAYLLHNKEPLGVGLTGKSEVLIAKDRNAGLRRHAIPASKGLFHFADLILTSHHENFVEVTVEQPTGRDPNWRPTVLMQRVAEYLNLVGEADSKRAIRTNVRGKEATVLLALDHLIGDGYVSAEPPYRLLRPYPS